MKRRKLVEWDFKCLKPKCRNSFKAYTPLKDYNNYLKCSQCGSEKFVKEIKK